MTDGHSLCFLHLLQPAFLSRPLLIRRRMFKTKQESCPELISCEWKVCMFHMREIRKLCSCSTVACYCFAWQMIIDYGDWVGQIRLFPYFPLKCLIFSILFYITGVYWIYILSILPGSLGCNFQYTLALEKRKALHCLESGWIGKYAPWGNLHPSALESASGGVFSYTSLLSAVYYYNSEKKNDHPSSCRP